MQVSLSSVGIKSAETARWPRRERQCPSLACAPSRARTAATEGAAAPFLRRQHVHISTPGPPDYDSGMPGFRRTVRLFARALRLRCPNCGQAKVFTSWFRMRTHCPVCGLKFERGEEGYQVGSYMFNIVAAELIFAAVFVGVMVATWPSPPWKLLEYGGIALMIVAPFVFYPFSKTLFLAFDLVFRPAAHDELAPRASSGSRAR